MGEIPRNTQSGRRSTQQSLLGLRNTPVPGPKPLDKLVPLWYNLIAGWVLRRESRCIVFHLRESRQNSYNSQKTTTGTGIAPSTSDPPRSIPSALPTPSPYLQAVGHHVRCIGQRIRRQGPLQVQGVDQSPSR